MSSSLRVCLCMFVAFIVAATAAVAADVPTNTSKTIAEGQSKRQLMTSAGPTSLSRDMLRLLNRLTTLKMSFFDAWSDQLSAQGDKKQAPSLTQSMLVTLNQMQATQIAFFGLWNKVHATPAGDGLGLTAAQLELLDSTKGNRIKFYDNWNQQHTPSSSCPRDSLLKVSL